MPEYEDSFEGMVDGDRATVRQLRAENDALRQRVEALEAAALAVFKPLVDSGELICLLHVLTWHAQGRVDIEYDGVKDYTIIDNRDKEDTDALEAALWPLADLIDQRHALVDLLGEPEPQS